MMIRRYTIYFLFFIAGCIFLSSFSNIFAKGKKPKVSIIIPVYNVEKYLSECMDSVVNQTFKDIEIICVNDGSTDNSLSILNYYKSKDNRVKLINQSNKGVSSARNKGIEVAEGEYVTFVDPDDVLNINAYEVAISKIQSNVDILVWGYNAFPNASNWWIRAGTSENAVYNNNSVNAYFNGKSVSVVVWNKFYKKSMLERNHLRFNENLRMSEDVAFNMNSFVYAKKVQFIKDKLYNYRIKRDGSLTDKYKGKVVADNHKIMFRDVLHNWKRVGALKGNEVKILTFFTRMSYNVVKDINEQRFKQSYARELLNLFWSYMNEDTKYKLGTEVKNKLLYIQSLSKIVNQILI